MLIKASLIACQMLSKGTSSVSEIAYDLGFSDPKYFSSIFKKEMGIIPSEYRGAKLNNEMI